MNKIIEQRKQNWIDFYDLHSSTDKLIVVDYPDPSVPPKPMLWWETMPEREEWSYRRYLCQMENLEKLPDNTVPYLTMITGTEIFAEAFGCPVHKPEDNNPFALPLIRDVSEFHKLRVPKLEDTNLVKLFESADRLKARAGKDALLSLPDIQTPMDIAALIWEKSDFYMAMFEEESAVTELALMVQELLYSFLDEWFRRYGKAFIAHYPDYYMPFGVTVSEDEIGIVNEEMYRRFFRKELHDMAERYGAIGIHSCASAEHQWENLKCVPNLKLLNLGRDEKICKASCTAFQGVTSLYHGVTFDTGDLPRDGVHFAHHAWAPSLDEAIRLTEAFMA